MQWKPQIYLVFNIWKRKKITDICIVLQKWPLISYTLACVWLPEGTLSQSKFFL